MALNGDGSKITTEACRRASCGMHPIHSNPLQSPTLASDKVSEHDDWRVEFRLLPYPGSVRLA